MIRHHGRCLQLQPGRRHYGPSQSQALVCEYENGCVEVYYRGERMGFHEIVEPIPEVTGRPGGENPIAEEGEARSSLALGLRDASWQLGTARGAARCAASFRFALKSRATLQDAARRNAIHQKGTFLTSFDMRRFSGNNCFDVICQIYSCRFSA